MPAPPAKPASPAAPPIKVVVIDDENQILMLVKHALEKNGFSVVTVNDPLRAVETCAKELPRIVVSDLMMPRLDGYGVLKGLRANPLTAAIPVVFLSAAPPQDNLPRAFQFGVVGYFEKPFHPARLGGQLKDLLAEVALRKNVLHGSLRRTSLEFLVDLMERERRSGLLEVRGTDGQGRITFAAGRMTEASYDGAMGDAAMTKLKALVDGEFKLSGMDGVQTDIVELSEEDIAIDEEDDEPKLEPIQITRGPTGSKGRVLIVDDEPDILKIMERSLSTNGYDVSVASNGVRGLEAAVKSPPDVVICDIMMPEMDGWQLYHRLRADFRINEARFIFLSAYPDLEAKLKEAGVAADGYLAKGVMLGQLIARIEALLGPRRDMEAVLSGGLNGVITTRVEAVGIKYVLRALHKAQFTGTLRVENIWHSITAEIVHGQPASVDDRGMVEASGSMAFEELCAQVSGDLFLSPESGAAKPNIDVKFELLIHEAERDLTEAEQRVVDTNLVTADSVRIDGRILDFYMQMVPQRLLPILQAVRAGLQPRQIMGTIDLPPTEIEEVLRDLVRKRILNFDLSAT